MWTNRRSGNNQQRSQHDHRDCYERDYNRVIHCPAFRRLQCKTQILGTKEGDFHRTRLTHSLEVSSIARSISRNLRQRYHDVDELIKLLPSDDLITAISLLHDIGHPPFGHGGEVALNYMMRDHGGFEGNGQTLRLLTKIENSYGEFGLDLARRTLLGILKYPVAYSTVKSLQPPDTRHQTHKYYPTPIKINDWIPPKCYLDCEQAAVDWILQPLISSDKQLLQQLLVLPDTTTHGKSGYKSFDCSIMDIADDIANGVHDLEDAIYLKLIQKDQLNTQEFKQLFEHAFPPNKRNLDSSEQLIEKLFNEKIASRKDAIGGLVNSFIVSTSVQTKLNFAEPLLKTIVVLEANAYDFLKYLKKIIHDYVINSHEARTIEYGGQTVVQLLFEAISSNPEQLLSPQNRENYQQQGLRAICDYIANMTDEYAYHMHERLFGFNSHTVLKGYN